jgi:hypothetical protein
MGSGRDGGRRRSGNCPLGMGCCRTGGVNWCMGSCRWSAAWAATGSGWGGGGVQLHGVLAGGDDQPLRQLGAAGGRSKNLEPPMDTDGTGATVPARLTRRSCFDIRREQPCRPPSIGVHRCASVCIGGSISLPRRLPHWPARKRRRWVIRAMPPRRVSVTANMVGRPRHYHQDGRTPGNAHPRLTTPDPGRERACPARDPPGCDAIDSGRRRNRRTKVLDPPYPSRAPCRLRTTARPVEADEVDRKVPPAGRTSLRNSMT